MTEHAQQVTLLIVDDTPDNIKMLLELFRHNYRILIANSGDKARRILSAHDLPDLILLDVIMPGIDGYDLCKQIKSDPRTRHIPIIFITGKTREEDQVRGFEAGAVDYVCKPFSPVIVKARVQTHVELKKQREFLESLSFRDGLTGIFNRRRYDEYLKETWDVARKDVSPLSIILIDIDHFKLFNDHYGHQEGDECLKKVAAALASSLKRKIDLVARYGGEEFACILPKTSLDGAMKIAEEFQNNVMSLHVPHAFSATSRWVTISQGVSAMIPDGKSSCDLLAKFADEALYRSKTEGRNRVTAHPPATRNNLDRCCPK